MNSRIRKLLDAASRAPSGKNAQPWRFSVSSHDGKTPVIDIYLDPERDRSLYNWKQRASYFAVGAALENLLIAAPGLGFGPRLELPENGEPFHAARVTLEAANAKEDPLSERISARVTNRKPFEQIALTESELTMLIGATRELGGDVRFVNSRETITRLAEVASSQERIMLRNRALHDFFFSHINWNEQEDEAKKVGFFIDTLELPPPARIMFKVLSSWRRTRFLTRFFGIDRVVSQENTKLYASCGAIGGVFSDAESSRAALAAGRTMERVWLTATKAGLSIQPLAGIVYLTLRLKGKEGGGGDIFSPAEISAIESASRTIESTFGAVGRTCYFMFRVGRSEPPTARSRRFNIDEITRIV